MQKKVFTIISININKRFVYKSISVIIIGFLLFILATIAFVKDQIFIILIILYIHYLHMIL